MAKIEYLSLDLETYSSVDIRSSGAYAYSESPDFQILLLGYRFDDMEEAKVIDLSKFVDKEEAVDYLASHHPDVYDALTDDQVIKTAFNANFERTCLGRYFGYMDPAQWRCTMVRCGAAGLPMSLEGAGAALHLPEDKAKMKIGKALITYFCKPCKPTKTNGGRRRNLPQHDKEKWRLFKEYCARDVDTEHTILEIVGLDVLPESEQRLWELDQKMNDYGVRLDVPYIEGILEYSENRNEELKAEAKELTGLENPNSVAQLREWLSDHGVETTSLTKADVTRILSGDCGETVRRVLEIRQALGKTSTKKYAAMMEAVCGDDRLRGILQYYGANRSGRWAGRIVQVHNLPQNHIDDLDWVRRKIAEQDFEAVEMVYGELAFLFSQLIRTAFIPSEGNTFIVSDFSAIEARVLAWLAGEKWRMDVFKNGGDIYCQSASAMFGVPVEKHGINGHLRQKGKVAELACIAEGSPVLTDKGLVPIQDVTTDMTLWDGEDWVSHDSVIYKGEKEVITYEGLTATEDHLVWVEGKSEPVHFGVAASSGAHLVQTGDGRRKIWLGADYKPGEEMEQELESVLYADGVPRLWCRPMDAPEQPYKREVEGLSAVLSAEKDPEVVRQKANSSKAEMHESERQRLPELRSEGDQVLLSQCEGGGALSDRDLRSSGQIDGIRPDRLERGLCSRESEIRGAGDQSGQSAEHDTVPIRAKVLAIRGERCGAEAVIRDDTRTDHRGCEEGSTGKTESLERDRKKVRVYDIRNAGRHHRFTVSGKLVHNCGYQGGIGAMKQMDSSGAIPEEELPGIVARWREASPNIVRLWYSMERAAKMAILDSRPKSRPVYLKKFDPKRARENERIMGADPGEYSDWFIDHEACVAFYMDGDALKMKLPSGRCLSYWNARVVRKEDGRDHIVYEGVNQTTKQWTEIETYGGKLVENGIQGIARDCLAETLKRVSAAGYHIVMHVHDEIIVDTPKDTAEESFEEITELMAISPVWAPGLILKGDGYMTDYYRKD